MAPLFMNQKVHPNVFKGKSNGKEIRQVMYRTNVVSDIVKQQQSMNQKVLESIQQMSTLVHHSKNEQLTHYHTLAAELDHKEKMNHELLEKIENEEIWKETMIDQLKIQEKSSFKLTKSIENQENLYQELQLQLQNQEVLFKSLVEKIELQDVFHKTILEQIEKQEAINHKILRQLDNLKATLFERVTHIVDKVEFNYKQVLTLFFDLFSKRDYNEKTQQEEAIFISQIDATQDPTQDKIAHEMERIL